MTPLTVELVPSTCWGSNLRSVLTGEQWATCKRYASAMAGRRCQICGGTGTRWPVECHEIWRYDDDTLTQHLDGLIALCPTCHRCKHAGFAAMNGHLGSVLIQLCEVNGWQLEHAELYLEAVFEVYNRRSQRQWNLDTTWLITLGLPGGFTPAADRTPNLAFGDT